MPIVEETLRRGDDSRKLESHCPNPMSHSQYVRRKWCSNGQKLLRKSKENLNAQLTKFSSFAGQRPIVHHHYI